MYVRDPDSLTGPFLVSGALFFYYSTRRRLARTHAMAIKFKHEGQRILLFALFHFPTFGRRRSVIWMYGNSSRPHPLGSNTALPLCIYMCVWVNVVNGVCGDQKHASSITIAEWVVKQSFSSPKQKWFPFVVCDIYDLFIMNFLRPVLSSFTHTHRSLSTVHPNWTIESHCISKTL